METTTKIDTPTIVTTKHKPIVIHKLNEFSITTSKKEYAQLDKLGIFYGISYLFT